MPTTDYINQFKQEIMNRFREVNAEKNHVLPQAWLNEYLSNNVQYQAFFDPAMQQLQAENLIEYQKLSKDSYHIMLTQLGEDYLYPNFKEAEAKEKIRHEIFAKFKSNHDHMISSLWLNTLYFAKLNPKEQRIFNEVIESMINAKLMITGFAKIYFYLTKEGEKSMNENLV